MDVLGSHIILTGKHGVIYAQNLSKSTSLSLILFGETILFVSWESLVGSTEDKCRIDVLSQCHGGDDVTSDPFVRKSRRSEKSVLLFPYSYPVPFAHSTVVTDGVNQYIYFSVR